MRATPFDETEMSAEQSSHSTPSSILMTGDRRARCSTAIPSSATGVPSIASGSSPNRSWGSRCAQLAVAWTLHNPGVDVAIVGTRDPNHVDATLAAADLDLDDEVMQRIDRIVIDAVPVGGPSPEGM